MSAHTRARSSPSRAETVAPRAAASFPSWRCSPFLQRVVSIWSRGLALHKEGCGGCSKRGMRWCVEDRPSHKRASALRARVVCAAVLLAAAPPPPLRSVFAPGPRNRMVTASKEKGVRPPSGSAQRGREGAAGRRCPVTFPSAARRECPGKEARRSAAYRAYCATGRPATPAASRSFVLQVGRRGQRRELDVNPFHERLNRKRVAV